MGHMLHNGFDLSSDQSNRGHDEAFWEGHSVKVKGILAPDTGLIVSMHVGKNTEEPWHQCGQKREMIMRHSSQTQGQILACRLKKRGE